MGIGVYDRMGEHAAAAWKSVNLMPLEASQSIFGVLISPPKHPQSEKPRSSATMMRKVGRVVGAIEFDSIILRGASL
jgi:hypothetical protein